MAWGVDFGHGGGKRSHTRHFLVAVNVGLSASLSCCGCRIGLLGRFADFPWKFLRLLRVPDTRIQIRGNACPALLPSFWLIPAPSSVSCLSGVGRFVSIPCFGKGCGCPCPQSWSGNVRGLSVVVESLQTTSFFVQLLPMELSYVAEYEPSGVHPQQKIHAVV